MSRVIKTFAIVYDDVHAVDGHGIARSIYLLSELSDIKILQYLQPVTVDYFTSADGLLKAQHN